jgi:ABC-type oligopeptide transport system ATPase subunit
MTSPILSVKNLKKYFKTGSGSNTFIVKAVDDISFDVHHKEVFSLVGESGCGKTTTGRTIIQLEAATSGTIHFENQLIGYGSQYHKEVIKKLKNQKKQLKRTSNNKEIQEIDEKIKLLKEEINNNINNVHYDRSLMNNLQMIFQDPISSLNPRMTVKEIIAEGLKIAGEKNQDVINNRINEMLNTVGLVPEHANRYPHEFSGGQRQRIGIARALAVNPKLIIADEPISALDVSIKAQVINLMNDLREEFGLTILFIAHDLSVVRYFSDRIAVMHAGKIVELASKKSLFDHPLHPYTKALISAIPQPDPDSEKTRKRIIYDPRLHDYSVSKPSLQKISEDHFVYGNDEEIKEYKKEIK